MEQATRIAGFYGVEPQFTGRFLDLSKERILKYFHDGVPVSEEEMRMAKTLRSLDEASGEQLLKMIDQVETSVRQQEHGSLLIVNEDFFAQLPHKCNVPEELAQLAILPKEADADKQFKLQPHLGRVELKYHVNDDTSYTLSMPTDVFCVLNCFNGLDDGQSLTRDQIFSICAADRLDDILATLISNVPRTSSALLIQKEDGSYVTNDSFTSRVKKLRL